MHHPRYWYTCTFFPVLSLTAKNTGTCTRAPFSSIKFNCKESQNSKYADDTVPLAGSMHELQGLVCRAKAASETTGLILNASTTQDMKTKERVHMSCCQDSKFLW